MCQGDYIAQLDADDRLKPTALEELMNFLESHPRYGMVYSDYEKIDANGQFLTYSSPIFKVVQQKWCKALYTVLKQSPTPPEYAVGEDSEGSNVDRSVVVLQ